MWMTKYQTGKEKKHWLYLKKRAGVCEKRSHVRRVRCWAKLSPAPLLFHSYKMGRSSHLVPHGHRWSGVSQWQRCLLIICISPSFSSLGCSHHPHRSAAISIAQCALPQMSVGTRKQEKKVSSRRRLGNSGTWDTWSKSFIQLCFSLLIAGWQDRFLIMAFCLSSQLSTE